MPRVTKKGQEAKQDVLEVIHHEIPDTAAGAGAAAIPARTYAEGGMTWRRMLRAVSITEATAFVVLLASVMVIYDLDFFAPIAIAAVLYAGSALWIPRMSKASVVYSLVVNVLALLMFGGMFFGWTGFLYPTSWFEMAWATTTVLVPIAGIVAAVATLRRREGNDAARTTATVTAAVASLVVVVGLVGNAVAKDATRLPGDVTLTATNMEFEQATLTAGAGDVAIYFENNDPFVHNVKLDGYGTSDNAPGGKSVRHVFKNVTAGTYEYICAIHPDMKGTLTVT